MENERGTSAFFVPFFFFENKIKKVGLFFFFLLFFYKILLTKAQNIYIIINVDVYRVF